MASVRVEGCLDISTHGSFKDTSCFRVPYCIEIIDIDIVIIYYWIFCCLEVEKLSATVSFKDHVG